MYCHSASFFPRGDAKNRNYQTPFSDLGELEQPAGFRHGDALDFSNTFSLKSGHVGGVQFGGLDSEARALGVGLSSSATGNVDADQLVYHRGVTATATSALPLNGHFENWADSGMVDNSQQTDTSTDVETEDRTTNQFPGGQSRAFVFVDCLDQIKKKPEDPKALRRLAQNREAARKSRMRKKAYVQQLENSQLKLCQMEQELQHVRQQNVSVATGFSGGQSHSPTANGTLAFDMDYARWLDDHRRLINDLRLATYSEVSEHELRYHVNGVMAHYEEIFKLKSTVAKTDVFHILTGMWETPVERFFMWLGGFRSSELLKIIGNRIEPLTDQQLMGICNLQQSSQQAEDALSQGMEALQQSLVETLSSVSLASPGSGNVADYMGQMAIAMGKLATLENFIHQADLLRQQTLQQMQRILTTRQAARALLVISDYVSRLRALSSLWVARPRE